MHIHVDKAGNDKSLAAINNDTLKKKHVESAFQFEDHRPEAITQRKVQAIADNSSQIQKAVHFQRMANHGQTIQRKNNGTGLPDHLKTGIESLSGYSMDDVKVHYNSAKPVQLQAHAYAQGTEIHIAPGQEKHLPHEAWHVVQQKQGRVRPTLQMKGGKNINDDKGLEKEADVMGAAGWAKGQNMAVQRDRVQLVNVNPQHGKDSLAFQKKSLPGNTVIQRMIVNVGRKKLDELDWVTLSTIGFALDESGEGQEIVNREDADFSKIGLNERIYLVGHGTGVQTVGALKEDQINILGRKLKEELPELYRGDIVAMNCRAGQIPEEEGFSGVEMLGRAMGRPHIPVYGPRGKSYSHSVLVPQVLDPERENDKRPEYDEAKKTISQEWSKMVNEVRKEDIKKQAEIAKKFTAEFYHVQINALSQKGMLLEKGWLRYGL